MWQDALGWLWCLRGPARYGGSGEDAELPALSARWIAFIAAHRSELEAGKKFSLDDPAVTSDLVRGLQAEPRRQTHWPPGR
jgi:hypothetical protein